MDGLRSGGTSVSSDSGVSTLYRQGMQSCGKAVLEGWLVALLTSDVDVHVHVGGSGQNFGSGTVAQKPTTSCLTRCEMFQLLITYRAAVSINTFHLCPCQTSHDESNVPSPPHMWLQVSHFPLGCTASNSYLEFPSSIQVLAGSSLLRNCLHICLTAVPPIRRWEAFPFWIVERD
jgi:hypothetical protein